MTPPLVDVGRLRGRAVAPAPAAAGGGPAGVLAAAGAEALFLDGASTRAAYDAFARRDLLRGDDGFGNSPFAGGVYRVVESHRVADPEALRAWLDGRGVAPGEPSLLLPVFAPRDEPAVLAPWRTVRDHAADLFAGDDLVVVAASAAFCLYSHHDGLVTFARDLAEGEGPA